MQNQPMTTVVSLSPAAFCFEAHDMRTVENDGEARIEKMPDAEPCDMCGHGFTPDERMDFSGKTREQIQAAGYMALTEAQLMMATAECCFAKVREMEGMIATP